MKEDQSVIEEFHELRFENPAVTEPAEKGRQYFGKAKLKWTLRANERAIECSDKAALALVESILFVYKTAAGYFIKKARISIDSRTDVVPEIYSHHEEARALFAEALTHLGSLRIEAEREAIRQVDKIIACYCNAIKFAKMADCSE